MNYVFPVSILNVQVFYLKWLEDPGWDPLCAKPITFSGKESCRIILSCFNKVPLFKTVISDIICFYGVRRVYHMGCKVFHFELYLLGPLRWGHY